MSASSRTTWTCDRCGERSSQELNGQPSYWVRLTRAQPPNHAEPRRQGDLCTACRNAFDEWWRTLPGQGCDECRPEPHEGGYGLCECECHPADAAEDFRRACETIDAMRGTVDRKEDERRDVLRVLFHVISTNKNFDTQRPNELTDDAIRIGHEFLVEQGWWPPTERDARIAPVSDSGRTERA